MTFPLRSQGALYAIVSLWQQCVSLCIISSKIQCITYIRQSLQALKYSVNTIQLHTLYDSYNTILAEHMYNLSCASKRHCFYPNNGFTFMLALYMYTCSNLDFLRHAKRHNLCKGKVKCWPSITNTIGFCFKIFVSDNCDEPTIRFLRKYWRCCTVCHFDSIERN